MKNLFIFSFKKAPYYFLASIIIFLILEILLSNSPCFWRILYEYSTPGSGNDALRFQAQLKMMSKEPKNKKVLLTGSSQVREGIDISQLNSAFMKRNTVFYNLGVSGGAQPIDAFMYKEKLIEKYPEMIVFGCFIGSFYDNYKFEKIKYYFSPCIIPYFYKYIGIKELYGYKGCFLDSYLGLALPLYRYRESIGWLGLKICSSIMRGKPPLKRNFRFSKDLSEEKLRTLIRELDTDKFSKTSYTILNKKLFTTFSRYIRKNGIKLLIIDMPTNPMIKNTYNKNIDEEYEQLLIDTARAEGYLYLSRSQLPVFSEEDFIDFTHLNAKGRKKLTDFLEIYLNGKI